MMQRRATSADVARRAGVSRATVSYVLNDRPGQSIPAATRQRVRDAAAQLGYVPNHSARALRGKQAPVVLVLTPPVPFGRNIADMVDTLTSEADRAGYSLVSMRSGEIDALESAILRLRPLLVLPMLALTAQERELCERTGTPGVDAWDHGIGGRIPARLQVERLHRAGRERLAYLGTVDPALAVLDAERAQGVAEACDAAGLPAPRVARLGAARSSESLGPVRELLREWTSGPSPVTGVACYNDLWAAALLHAARLEGVDVPGSLSVIGVDDEPLAVHLDPPLTSVDYDAAGLARQLFADGQALVGAQADGAPATDGASGSQAWAPHFRVIDRGSV